MAPPVAEAANVTPGVPAQKHRRPKTLKPPMARASRLARECAGLTQQQLATALRADRAHVSRCEDPTAPHAISVLHVARAPREYARAMIQWQADHHGLQVTAAPAQRFSSGRARLAAVALANAELTTALTADMRDPQNVEAVLKAAQRARDLSAEAWAWAAAELEREGR